LVPQIEHSFGDRYRAIL